jgi:glycosyltransferase involved in cell wall biosynthesis
MRVNPTADVILSSALSVVIPISERYDDVSTLYAEYRDAVSLAVGPAEFIYVLDGDFDAAYEELKALQSSGEPIRVVRLTRRFGESTALVQGIEHARADTLLVLPAYYQVDPASLTGFIGELGDDDMIVARRWPRIDSKLNQLSTRLFHGLLGFVTGYHFKDVGCGVRLLRRRVLDEITIYGDQHRFLAMLAAQRGFRVREINLKQAKQDPKVRVYRPGVYFQRVLDMLAVFFLVRFTKRPLRFFGPLGSALIALGSLVLALVIVQRLFFDVALADRPALLLGALILVLGVQLFAIGLIAELIIFTHASDLKEYAVAETVNMIPADDWTDDTNDNKDNNDEPRITRSAGRGGKPG